MHVFCGVIGIPTLLEQNIDGKSLFAQLVKASYELRVYEFTSYELRATSYDLRVNM